MKLLGRLPAKSTPRALMFRDFVKFLTLPKSQLYWQKRKPIPLRSYGNKDYGCCTIASQANLATRMELLETKRLINITDEEVVRVYFAMTTALYGGGDTGAYEDDALNRWRNPDLTFKDDKGHPLTIAAYLRLNAKDPDELKAAIALSGAKGIKICLNLPRRYERLDPPAEWDVPANSTLTGEDQPGSWGGHSLEVNAYNQRGMFPDHTWDVPNNLLTWEAAAAYLDEAHVVIDSLDAWRQQLKGNTAARLNLADVRDAVNGVSSIRI